MAQQVVVWLCAIALASALSSPANSEWPDRPIRIIAPSTAGGAADTFARVLADKLSPMLGATIIGGLVGVEAKAERG